MSAESSYKIGNAYPYDDTQEGDWAMKAARGVISDLSDRRGIKNGFYNIDADIKIEIVQSLAEIIRFASQEGGLTLRALDGAKYCPPQFHFFVEGVCAHCGYDDRPASNA